MGGRAGLAMGAAVCAMGAMGSACIPRLTSSGGPDAPWVAPVNGWNISLPPEDLTGEGYEVGQVVPDFRLVDQHGDEVSLWQFYGDIALMDVSTIWCAPCQELASHAEETWLEYRDRGFVHVTVLHEDLEGDPPDQEDLGFWVDAFGLTSPVLADGDAVTLGAIRSGQYPTVLIIGRDMKVQRRLDGVTEAEVRAAIEAAL